MNSCSYYLRSHVFVCPVNRYWVFLDLNRDRYLCVHGHDFEALAPFVHGWNRRFSTEPPTTAEAVERQKLAHEFIQFELLSESPKDAKDCIPITSERCRSMIDGWDQTPSVWDLAKHVLGFVLACGRADRWLKTLPLKTTVELVRQRKGTMRKDSNFDFVNAGRLIGIFNALRPLYPRPFLCLFDCLALLEFLAAAGLYPSWVFGVTADPFEAHCWLQEGSKLLSDTKDRASLLYSPIMSV